jgi:hypothetical protein
MLYNELDLVSGAETPKVLYVTSYSAEKVPSKMEISHVPAHASLELPD